jgi:hypothetical protein
LDEFGYPHISYHDRSNDNLKYSYQDGSGWWNTVTVDASAQVGEYTSIALYGSGYPHISYYDSLNDNLKYAYKDWKGWHIETVDTAGGDHTSIALDNGGLPRISYHGYTILSALKYAHKEWNGWHIKTVDAGRLGTGSSTSIALDKNAYPHISYCAWDDLGMFPEVRYAYQDGAGWNIEIVGTGPLQSAYTSTSIALNRDGYPHISYSGWSVGIPPFPTGSKWVTYAYKDSAGWHFETVENVGSSTSIALDGNDYPHISYYDDTSGDLKYAYKDWAGWHIETVDSEGDVGWYTSIALDRAGNPHISYYDNTNGDLRYACRMGPPTYSIDYVVAHWVSEALDPNDPCQISLDQILQAIAWWAAATEVPHTGGQTIDLNKILDLIAKWAAATCIVSSAAPQSLSLPKALSTDKAASIANAARSITSTTGGLAEVTVTVEAKQAITGLALDEDLPQGWEITSIDNAGATFNAQETQWLWLAVNAGETKTIRYQVEVPSDASLDALYEITGVIRAASPSLVLEVVRDVQLGGRLPGGKLEVVAIPNPVRDVHTVTFQVRGALVPLVETIKVQIFDLAGRLVYEKQEAGTSLDWHTDNSYGEYLVNGVYLYKLYALIEGKWVVSEVKKLAILM